MTKFVKTLERDITGTQRHNKNTKRHNRNTKT